MAFSPCLYRLGRQRLPRCRYCTTKRQGSHVLGMRELLRQNLRLFFTGNSYIRAGNCAIMTTETKAAQARQLSAAECSVAGSAAMRRLMAFFLPAPWAASRIEGTKKI